MTPDEILDSYDRGRLSRRELLAALSLIGFSSAQAQTPTPAVAGSTLNHINVLVRNLEQSRDFYSRLFGARKTREQNAQTWGLIMSESSFTIRQSNDKQGLEHFGVGVDHFDAQQILGAVKRALPASDAYVTPDGTAVSVHDPNGVLVQIASKQLPG